MVIPQISPKINPYSYFQDYLKKQGIVAMLLMLCTVHIMSNHCENCSKKQKGLKTSHLDRLFTTRQPII